MRIVLGAAALLLLSSTAHAQCKNAYFPAKVGSVWTYSKGDSRQTMTVSAVKGATVSMDLESTRENGEPVKVTVTGECNAEGVRVNLGELSGTDAKMKTTNETGYTIIADSKMKVGATWTESKVMELSGKGGMTMNMDVKTVHTVESSEKVKVPAGSYTALKIRQDTETVLRMDGPMAAMIPKEPQKSTSYTWIAKDVGVVKTLNELKDPRTGKSATSTTELAGFKAK